MPSGSVPMTRNGRRAAKAPAAEIPLIVEAALSRPAAVQAQQDRDVLQVAACTAAEASRKAQAGERLSVFELETVLVRHAAGLLQGSSEEQERAEKLLLRLYERRSTTAAKGARALLRRARMAGNPGPEQPPPPAG